MAPGTAGSAVALVLVLVAVTLAGIWAGSRVERALDAKDPGIIVIDEVAGMFLSVLFLPRTIPVLAAAFLLFRAFDIVKPFPVRRFERLPGGIGIMADDLAAGVYANVALRACIWAFGHLVT